MRKKLTEVVDDQKNSENAGSEVSLDRQQKWLDLESIAEVELSSEQSDMPIEGALLEHNLSGWSASESGQQTIRLVFDQPQTLRRIYLEFVEAEQTRTQEYVIRWSTDHGGSFQEVVRQQWNFSPDGSACEKEDHEVNLLDTTELELSIIPDISGGSSLASLHRLRLA